MYTKQLIDDLNSSAKRSVPQLVLKNGKIMDVFSGLIFNGDIAINNGKIIGVGIYSGEKEIDCTNKFICPALIDPSVRIDTTFLNIAQFTANYVKCGVTTVVIDNQKIATAMGKKIKKLYKINLNKQVGQVFGLIPPSLPKNKVEKPKYKSKRSLLSSLNKYFDFIGFGNFLNINQLDEFKYKKIINKSHKPTFAIYKNNTQDELNFARVLGLNCLLSSSPTAQIQNILQYGFYLCLQLNNSIESLNEQLNKIKALNINCNHICFGSGEMFFNEFFNLKGVNFMVAQAIKSGIDPVQAVKMGSYNAAQLLKLDKLGAIAPGYKADLLIVNDINNFNVEQVYISGKLIDTLALANIKLSEEEIIKLNKKINVSQNWLEHKLISKYAKKEFRAIEYDNNEVKITSLYNSSNLSFSEYNKVVVIARNSFLPKAYFGLLKYLNLNNSAIGFTVSNNVNNIVIIGSDNKNIMTVFNELKKTNGGIVISHSNIITASIKLPISGILSNLTAADFALEFNTLLSEFGKVISENLIDKEKVLKELFNLTNIEIGSYKFTPKKIYDVKNYKYIN